MLELEELYHQFRAKNIDFIGVGTNSGEGNIIGTPIIGNVKRQIDTINKRLELICP